MISTSQKISYPIARITSFFENCFPPNFSNAFHQQKNSSDQKVLFLLDRKSVSTYQMKDLLKNVFRLYVKTASTLKSLKISENIKKTGVYQQEYISSLKIDFPQVSIIVSTKRKNSVENNTVSSIQKNSFPLAGMKDLLKNMFQLKNEQFSLAAVDSCLRK